MHSVRIRLLSEDARIPEKTLPGDAGWDLFTSKVVIIPPREFLDVPTDVAIAMPADVWGRICGRSSTLRTWHCLVNEGIIDTGFRGELYVGVWNLSDKPRTIPVGTRLGQLIFHKHIEDVSWMPVADLPPSQRGESGFGSSGR